MAATCAGFELGFVISERGAVVVAAAGADPADTVSVDDAMSAPCASCVFAPGGTPGPGPWRNHAGGSRLAHDAYARRACVEGSCAACHVVAAFAEGARASLVDAREGVLACFTGEGSDDFLRVPGAEPGACATRCCGSAVAVSSRGA